MSNPRYQSGAAFEYQVVHDLRSQGYRAQRTAGSHSAVDILAVGAATAALPGRTLFVQCKTDGRISTKERGELMQWAELGDGSAILASKQTEGRRTVIRYEVLSDDQLSMGKA